MNLIQLFPGGKKEPPLCKGRWHAERDGGIVMQRKHNKDIVPTARMLRKNMTKEEKHLWYDFLRTYPVRFSCRIRFDSYQNTEYGNI